MICPDKHFYLHSGVSHLFGSIFYSIQKKILTIANNLIFHLLLKHPQKLGEKTLHRGMITVLSTDQYCFSSVLKFITYDQIIKSWLVSYDYFFNQKSLQGLLKRQTMSIIVIF